MRVVTGVAYHTEMSIDKNNLLETFAVIRPDLSVRKMKVTPTLY